MTDQEWMDLDVMLASWWGSPVWTDTISYGYRMALNSFEPRAVAQSLEAFLNDGGTYRPSAAQIRARLVSTPSFVSWDEAWPLITQAIDRVKVSVYHADFDEQEQAAIDWLAEQDQVVAAYAARRGLCGRPGSLGHEPVYSDVGGAVLHRLAGDYGDAVTVAKERVAAGLPPVPERALLLARKAGSGGLSGGLAAVVEHARPVPKLEPGE